MKKRRAFLLTLLPLLLVVGIPTGFLVREYRQEQLNHALIAAVKANAIEKALAALRVGADANAKDNGDKPPTFRDSLNHLVSQLFHRNSQPQPQQTALALLYQLRMPETNAPSKRVGHDTILIPENMVLLAALLEHGADPNVYDRDGHTPLMNAACWRYTESMRLLLQHGAEIRAKSGYDGSTVLHWAVGSPEAVRLLIAQGADVNARTKEGVTPLMRAFGGPVQVQELLEAHADVNLRDWSGYTALDYNQGTYNQLRQKQFPYNLLSHHAYDEALDKMSNVEKVLRHAGAKTGQELDAEAKH